MSCGHFPTRRRRERGDIQNVQPAMRADKGGQPLESRLHPLADKKEKQYVERTFTSAWGRTRPRAFPFFRRGMDQGDLPPRPVKSAFTA